MSLSEKINLASLPKIRLCKLGSLMAGKLVSEFDKKELLSALSVQVGDGRRLANSTIAKVLSEEGHEIGITTVERHRVEACCCFRGKK